MKMTVEDIFQDWCLKKVQGIIIANALNDAEPSQEDLNDINELKSIIEGKANESVRSIWFKIMLWEAATN